MHSDQPDLYFDTVVLSNFLGVGAGDLLVRRYGCRMRITEEVLAETLRGGWKGHHSVAVLEEAILNNSICMAEPTDMSLRKDLSSFRRTLGAGEASCLAHAKRSHGVVVTDDRAARQFCDELHIPVTGTIGILMASVKRNALSLEESEGLLARMIKNGFYSPVARISDLLK